MSEFHFTKSPISQFFLSTYNGMQLQSPQHHYQLPHHSYSMPCCRPLKNTKVTYFHTVSLTGYWKYSAHSTVSPADSGFWQQQNENIWIKSLSILKWRFCLPLFLYIKYNDYLCSIYLVDIINSLEIIWDTWEDRHGLCTYTFIRGLNIYRFFFNCGGEGSWKQKEGWSHPIKKE